MHKGTKIRFEIHNILYDIYKLNKKLNNEKVKIRINKYIEKDISFINTVCLNTMRYSLHTDKIIKIHIEKVTRIQEIILLKSAITQIVFLNFKEYAVINSSVEIAKKLNIYHGFINAVLKKIAINKFELGKISISFNMLPNWFKSENKNLSKAEKENFIKTFYKEPNLHIVFKNSESLNNFEEELIKTSELSGFTKNKLKIKNLPSYKKGNWWVQDFSSFFPLSEVHKEKLFKKSIDLCAAPGGKSFQMLSCNKNIILNDKNNSRIEILKINLERLKFKTKIINLDVLKMDENKKFDFIILDAPCSAVGTVRKNPEILFHDKGPDFEKITNIQQKMLDKASYLLNKNGIILYMVCSFLKKETLDQVNIFLDKHQDFIIDEFKLEKKNIHFKKLIKNNYMHTLPESINGYNIDGYFAIYLRKN